MVRVGGGWVALDEFLQKNDPCRGKKFVNFNKNILFRIFRTYCFNGDTQEFHLKKSFVLNCLNS